MTANNLWGMGDGWAGSFGEAVSNYTSSSSSGFVNGIQGYNYVNESFSGAYATKKYEGDQRFNSDVGQKFYYAGYGNIFDYSAMEAGYSIHQASVTTQIQLALDGIGMTEVPILSQGAELISAGISFGQGDWKGGLIGLGAMIPIGGKAFEGMKIARRFTTGFQKHHLIPNAVYKKFGSELDNMGWIQGHGLNLKKLPTPFHANHRAYNRYVEGRIEGLVRDGNFNLQSMIGLQHTMRQQVNNAYLSGNFYRLNHAYK